LNCVEKPHGTEKTTHGYTVKKRKGNKNYSIVKEKSVGDLMFLACKKDRAAHSFGSSFGQMPRAC
jgi:hypothetical protein